ncbi:MAG TPA: DUF1559 domain-containing protein [Planctomycetaceae bacterium]|nr:DUF1559 domain-containing protein [Planctomycetaceae bacterium]
MPLENNFAKRTSRKRSDRRQRAKSVRMCASDVMRSAETPSCSAKRHRRVIATSGAVQRPASSGRMSNFRSDHPSGCLFLLCDGSVQFLNENVNMSTYTALSTIQGGGSVQGAVAEP